MAYGDYNGPNKADKGLKHGSCNRTRCQAPNAVWYNYGSYAWYCKDCARDIGQDPMNKRHWTDLGLAYPQFETVEMAASRGVVLK